MKKCCQSIIRNFHAAITTQLRLSAGKHNSILHAPAAARNLDEAIPLRSAETELQITIELHTTAILHKLQLQNRISTLKRKNGDFVTFSKKWKGKPSAPKCCQSTIRNFHATTKIRFTNFKIGTCKSQSESQDSILKNKYHSSSLGRSHSTAEFHNTIDLQRATVEHIALMHGFQCTKCLKTWFHAKATTPKTVARMSQLFSATEPPLTRKNIMLRANPTIQLASGHDVVTVTMRSTNSDLQKTIKFARQYWRTSTLREALAQPFHCDLHRLNGTTQENCNALL